MSTRPTPVAFALAALLGAAAAHADFQAALADYQAGRYDSARIQFLSLAELGDCSSQFNLGAMALQGQGGPQDSASAVGWLEAAAGNGCQQLVGNKARALAAKLSADQSRTAAGIVARYGADALRAEGVLNPQFSCPDRTTATIVSSPQAEYPRQAAKRREPAIVITALTIGADGHARDPAVLLSLPQDGFAAAAVEAWLNSLFTPASRSGRALDTRLQAKTVFEIEGATTLADAQPLKAVRAAADSGDAAARYQVGLMATLDGSLGISSTRAAELLLGAARDGNAQAQYWVGSQLRATAACHPRADGSVWLRHAAAGGSAAAQLLLASDLLRGTPSAEQTAQARALLAQAAGSDSYYVRKHVVALLAASPVEAVRDPAGALAIAVKLAAGDIQSDPQMFESVAAAYAANGDFHKAVAQQDVALLKANSLGWNTRAMSDRQSAYRHNEPWRGELFALQ
jgi:TPR repeat protein